MKIFHFTCLLILAVLAPAARAQWENVTYHLHGGWNAIYLHGDATHATPDVLFSSAISAGNADVLEVWRWNPNPTQTQFESSPLIPTTGTADWSVWTRGATTGNTLSSLAGQNAYLIRCSGGATDNRTVQILQKTLPPRGTWVRNGANLLGFPSATPAPSFTSYFATFPAAISSNTRLYRYVGGELGPNNPELIFVPSSRNVDRNQAYWFETPVVSTFYAPLEFSLSNLDGLSYGRAGSIITLRVRNRTNAAVTVTIAPVASDSAPSGFLPQVTGPVPVTVRTSAAGVVPPQYTLISTGFDRVIGPQSTVTLEFGIDRTAMTAAPGAFYASLLRFTDSGGLTDVRLPASALVPSLAGLWVGDVTVSDVANQSPARYHTCVVRRTEGTTFTEVTSRAARVGVNTLAPLSVPPGTGALSYQWKKNGVDLTVDGTGATLVLTSGEAALSGAFGSTTARPAPLRTLVHIDDFGTARLLSQVFVGKLAANEQLGLSTTEANLLATAKAAASRLVAVHLPPGTDQPLLASTGGHAIRIGPDFTCTVSIGFNAPANPFVHTYHPDHDNKDARGNALPEGVESYTVTRVCTFKFTASLPGVSAVGWGTSVLGGEYTEVITGLHKAPLAVSGTFVLRRVSEIGAIAPN